MGYIAKNIYLAGKYIELSHFDCKMMKNSLKSAYTSKICWGMCHLTLNHGMLDRQLKVWVLLSLITMFHHKQLLIVIAISFFTDHSLISSDHYLCMHIIFQFFGISQSAASLTMSCSSWRFSSLIVPCVITFHPAVTFKILLQFLLNWA